MPLQSPPEGSDAMTRATCRLRALRAVAAAAALLVAVAGNASACTNVLVSRGATATESTFVTYSCDGGVLAAVDVVAGEAHSQGTTLDVYSDLPYFRDDTPAEPDGLGQIPQAETTYRYIDVRGGADFGLRRFHDAVLGHGALPLELLERAIDEWILAEATQA